MGLLVWSSKTKETPISLVPLPGHIALSGLGQAPPSLFLAVAPDTPCSWAVSDQAKGSDGAI